MGYEPTPQIQSTTLHINTIISLFVTVIGNQLKVSTLLIAYYTEFWISCVMCTVLKKLKIIRELQ